MAGMSNGRKKTKKKRKDALSTTESVIGMAQRAGRAVRQAAGQAIKPGTGALAKRRAQVIESQVEKALRAGTRPKRRR